MSLAHRLRFSCSATPSTVQVDLIGEGVQSAADHARGSIRMPAGPASVDQADHPADLTHQIVGGPAEGEFVEQGGQPRQAVEARPALAGALVGQISGDLGGAAQSALRAVQRVNDARTGCCPQRCQGRPRQSGPPELRCREPSSVVAADRGTGVLVNLGGDIATAGPAPEGGWRVLVQDSDDDPASHVTIGTDTGLATSSTRRRRWWRAGAAHHHIVDPRTGASAEPVWRSVSVAADSCLAANSVSTAAIVRGRRAPAWISALGVPARLVDADGQERTIGGWPS